MENLTYAYAGDIVKTHEEDGSMFVYGKATGPDLDLDEQICDASWLREAMPEWMKFGNVREMHQPIAAGVGIELEASGDDWFLKSEVIDDNTKRKIEAKALKGYSIGIKGAKVVKDDHAKGGRIVGGTIVEVSYVDRPANPTAIASIAKSAGGTWNAVETQLIDVEQDEVEKADIPTDVVMDDDWKPENTYQPQENNDEYPADHQCDVCDGLGKLPETGESCPKCDGTGRIVNAEAEAGRSPMERTDSAEAKDVAPEVEKTEVVVSLSEQISALLPVVDKDASLEHDPAQLTAVRSAMIALIKAELDETLNGEENEIGDVRDLLISLQIFLNWWTGEASENETTAPFTSWDDDKEDNMAYVAMGVNADIIKAASSGTDEDVTALRAEIVKALCLEETVTEIAKAAQREEVDFLKSELERIKEMAAPGGPAITRTHAQSSKALDAERLKAEAEHLRHIAGSLTDAELRQNYMAKASGLDRTAAELLGA